MEGTPPRRIDWVILGGWLIALAAIRAGRVEETDPYWQIRAGLENLDGTPLARPDTWSWEPVGGLFNPNSPVWNVALALGWRAAGFWGLFAVTFVSILIYTGLVVLTARILGSRPMAILLGTLPVFAMAFAMLSPRATLAAQSLLLLAITTGYAWSRRAARAGLWTNAAVVGLLGFTFALVGNWVHVSWVLLSAAVAVGWAVLWTFTPGLGSRRRAALIASGSAGLAIGTALGPYGGAGIERTLTVRDAARGLILEWASPFTAGLAARWVPALALALVLAVGAASWVIGRIRQGRSDDQRVRLVAALAAIALPASLGGFVAIRFVGVSLLTLAPVAPLAVVALGRALKRAAGRRWGASSGRTAKAHEYASERFWRVVLSATLAVLAPLTLVAAAPHGRPPALSAVDALPPGCRLFSTSAPADVALLVRPDVTVWFDGRADYYGRERIEQFYGYLRAADPSEIVPAGTTCVLLPDPAQDPFAARLVAALESDEGWTLAARSSGLLLWLPNHS